MPILPPVIDPQNILVIVEQVKGPLQMLGDHVAYDLVKAGCFRLWDRIKNDPVGAKGAAVRNAVAYSEELAERIVRFRDEEKLTNEQIEHALSSPSVARVLEAAIITASTTDSTEVHRDLATIVAARLASSDGSTLSNLLHDACIKVESLNARQLHVLAYIEAVRYLVYPQHDASLLPEEQFKSLLGEVAKIAAAVGEPRIEYLDAQYFEALGVGRHRPMGARFGSSDDYLSLAQAMNPLQQPGLEIAVELKDAFGWYQRATELSLDHLTVHNVTLSLVGNLIGLIAFCRLANKEADLSFFELKTEDAVI
ncbi:MAG: LPO_1073/Vpar_1526 family protein [Vulcanimicrobiaceae bacterium]